LNAICITLFIKFRSALVRPPPIAKYIYGNGCANVSGSCLGGARTKCSSCKTADWTSGPMRLIARAMVLRANAAMAILVAGLLGEPSDRLIEKLVPTIEAESRAYTRQDVD